MALRFLPDPGILGAIGEGRAARLMEERAATLARRDDRAPGPAAAPVLVLAIGAERFGLPLDRAAEVLAAEPPTPLPGAPPVLLGLRARAGRLHAVLDLARLLGLPEPVEAREGEGWGGHDVLLRPLAGDRAQDRAQDRAGRLALRVGRVLAVLSPVPLPPGRAPPAPAGIAFHALIPAGAGGGEAILAVLDLERLLRPLAAPAAAPLPPAPPGA